MFRTRIVHVSKHVVLALSVVGLLAGYLLLTPTASAAALPVTRTVQATQVTRSPMVVGGFDQAVAQAHGYHIVTINGVQASVKDGTTTPDNLLHGNCGDSWIYIDAAGHLLYYYTTGFANLPLPAVFFGWGVSVAGPYGYEQTWTFGGGMFGTAWSSGNVYSYVDDIGFYDAAVTNPSWVILLDGSTCYSLGPTSQAFVP